jgi:hypothetical protein
MRFLLARMRATLEVPGELYRKVKAKRALQGRPAREVAVGLFRAWVCQARPTPAAKNLMRTGGKGAAPWFGSLRKYAKNARGRHEIGSIRKSITRGRAAESPEKERPS